jgi:polyhydroxyalkanoate synthesis regulator phasin
MVKKPAVNSLKKELVEIGIGVAAVVIVAELTSIALKLKKEGKLNSKDVGKMIQSTVSKYKGEGNKYVHEGVAKFDKLVEASPFVTKSDIKSLNAKIDRLTKLKKGKK